MTSGPWQADGVDSSRPTRTGLDDALLSVGLLVLAAAAFLLFGQGFALPCDGAGVWGCEEAVRAINIGFGAVGAGLVASCCSTCGSATSSAGGCSCWP